MHGDENSGNLENAPRSAGRTLGSDAGETKSGKPSPSSTRKIDANRRNERKSTGPRTERGKRHSRANALRHGIFAKSFLLDSNLNLDSREREQFKSWLQRLREHYLPADAAEQLLVERIAFSCVRLTRVDRYENSEIHIAQLKASAEVRRASDHLEQNPGAVIAAPDCRLITFLRSILEQVLRDGFSEDLKREACSIHPCFRDLYDPVYPKMKALKGGTGLELDGEVGEGEEDSPLSVAQRFARWAEYQTLIAVITALEQPLREQLENIERVILGRAAIPQGQALENTLRYRAQVMRELHRDSSELERLQRRRLGENVPPPIKIM